MKFGRLDQIDEVVHDFPDTYTLGRKISKSGIIGEPLKIRLGTPAWGDKGFVGKIYPVNAKPADYLFYYSRQFEAIELNTTYYRIPKKETVLGWMEKTPDTFRFCPKFPQSISNNKDLNSTMEVTARFFELIQNFDRKLGVSFLQLPQHFSIKRFEELRQYLEQLPRDVSTAVEFRHASWFNSNELDSDTFHMLDALGKGAVITDTSGRRDVLHLSIADTMVMVRFTGNKLHTSDFQRIDDWVAQISKWKTTSIQSIFFFLHQPQEHLCVEVAKYMVDKFANDRQIEIHRLNLQAGNTKQTTLF